MKKSFTKGLIAFGFCAAVVGFVACGDESSSGPSKNEETGIETEISSSSENDEAISSSSAKDEVSSSSKKVESSSSKKKDDSSSSAKNMESSSSGKVESSSSKNEVSSSSKKIESSSSSKAEVSSSSTKNKESSSSVKTEESSSSSKHVETSSSETKPVETSSSESSSSSVKPADTSSSEGSSSSSEKSSSSSLGIPFEIYDCSKYQCITTIHLNPNIKYGEYLDDRPAQNKVYRTVKIGEQEWMAQNLNYAKAGSICPLEEDSLCNLYGRLYKWDDAINACPSGWRLPNADDYKNLSNYVESNSNGLPVGTCLKYGENNIWGFSGVFAGFRTRIGADSEYGIYGYFWTSTEVEDKAKGRILVKNKDYLGYVTEYKEAMLSIRCIKN